MIESESLKSEHTVDLDFHSRVSSESSAAGSAKLPGWWYPGDLPVYSESEKPAASMTQCTVNSAGHTYFTPKISWKWEKNWLQSAQFLLIAQSATAIKSWSLKFSSWKDQTGLRKDNTITWAVALPLHSRRISIAQMRILLSSFWNRAFVRDLKF